MPRKSAGHVKIMFCLPPGLVKAIKRVATEKRQTHSTVVEEWLERGLAEHEARKESAK
ncbi:MAG: hypothetical protein WBV96_13105 [Polyangia bacterium]